MPYNQYELIKSLPVLKDFKKQKFCFTWLILDKLRALHTACLRLCSAHRTVQKWVGIISRSSLWYKHKAYLLLWLDHKRKFCLCTESGNDHYAGILLSILFCSDVIYAFLVICSPLCLRNRDIGFWVSFEIGKIERKNSLFTWMFTALFWTSSKKERCLIKDRLKGT